MLRNIVIVPGSLRLQDPGARPSFENMYDTFFDQVAKDVKSMKIMYTWCRVIEGMCKGVWFLHDFAA